MGKYLLLSSVALLLASCQPASESAVDPAEFNGRWNLTVPGDERGRAWWLEVSGAGSDGALTGQFVGAPGGGMYTPGEMSIRDGQLTFVFNRRYGVPGDDMPMGERPERRGVYTAKLAGERIEGTFEVEGHPETRVEWHGERAPVITDKDDGSWKEGEPVVLFNGKDLSGWQGVIPGRELGWSVENGVLVHDPPANNLVSEQKFWNFKLHAEYRLFEHSNSGFGLRGRYEVQVFEDYGKPPSKQGHGAIYYRIVPTENASLPIGEWQTMDVTLIGRDVTVVLNGKTIIDKAEIEGLTAVATDAHEDQPGPIQIQGDHRKIEIRKLTVTPLTQG